MSTRNQYAQRLTARGSSGGRFYSGKTITGSYSGGPSARPAEEQRHSLRALRPALGGVSKGSMADEVIERNACGGKVPLPFAKVKYSQNTKRRLRFLATFSEPTPVAGATSPPISGPVAANQLSDVLPPYNQAGCYYRNDDPEEEHREDRSHGG